jgi:hypothetical protein
MFGICWAAVGLSQDAVENTGESLETIFLRKNALKDKAMQRQNFN